MTLAFDYLSVYLLVWTRLVGMVLLNPLFGRNNVPALVRFGLSFCLALLLAPLQPLGTVANLSGVGFIAAVLLELAIGFIYGYVFQIFYYFLFFAGDLLDTDFGLSMAKTFDPSTNIQASFSSRLFTIVFALYIFATGSHLALIRLFAESFTLIPVGGAQLSVGLVTFLLKLFSSVFMLALRLAAPFMVAEFTLQVSMGILMKFIPQITIFVINFQLRIILGLFMLFLFAPFIGSFIDNYITALFDVLTDATLVLAGR